MELARDPQSSWAHLARGDTMVRDRIDRCLAECVRADDAESAAVRKLTALRKEKEPATGTWWADPPLTAKIEAILGEIRAEDAALKDPYAWAVAKWTIYQRRIEVMRDHAAISGTAGPYLVFIQVNAPPGTPIEQVGAEETSRARRILDHETVLFSAVYEAFHELVGKPLGLLRYDKSNLDEKTILKANVFADEATWQLYEEQIGNASWSKGTRAYYNREEPRFLVSYDPGTPERAALSDRAQAHVAVYQLLHFYTWDAARRSDGRELDWVACDARPSWLDHGFAALFASHRVEGGRYSWMQPREADLEDIWIASQAFPKRRWAMWNLAELLDTGSDADVTVAAGRRAFPNALAELTPEQEAQRRAVVDAVRPVFFSKSWSLASFLWHATDATGKPRYRDAFVRYLGEGLKVRQETLPGKGRVTLRLGGAEFRRAFGIESAPKFQAFEKEWLAFEEEAIARAMKPEWTKERDRVFERYGVK
jgi:hypothetical protein